MPPRKPYQTMLRKAKRDARHAARFAKEAAGMVELWAGVCRLV